MKNIFLIIAFIFISKNVSSQVHWLNNQDSIPNCQLIKSGKFINKETNEKSTSGFYIIFEDGTSTEYINNGEYYVKSKLKFETCCKYKSTVIEVTIPNYDIEIGSVVFTEIIETATKDNLVKLKSKMSGDEKEYIFVLEKVK